MQEIACRQGRFETIAFAGGLTRSRRNVLEALVGFAPRLNSTLYNSARSVDSWLSVKSYRWSCLTPEQNADHYGALLAGLSGMLMLQRTTGQAVIVHLCHV